MRRCRYRDLGKAEEGTQQGLGTAPDPRNQKNLDRMRCRSKAGSTCICRWTDRSLDQSSRWGTKCRWNNLDRPTYGGSHTRLRGRTHPLCNRYDTRRGQNIRLGSLGTERRPFRLRSDTSIPTDTGAYTQRLELRSRFQNTSRDKCTCRRSGHTHRGRCRHQSWRLDSRSLECSRNVLQNIPRDRRKFPANILHRRMMRHMHIPK